MNEYMEWFEKAKKDIHTAKFNFEGKEFEASAFFSQQAVEKGLKAIYIKKFKKLKRTHDIVFLAKELKLPGKLIDFCKEIGPAYTYTRYPDAVDTKEIDRISEEILGYAEEMMEWIEKNL